MNRDGDAGCGPGRTVCGTSQNQINLLAKLNRRVAVSRGDAQDWDSRVDERGINPAVAHADLEGAVRAVVQFNGENNVQARRIAKDKIHMFGGDAIERGLPATARILGRMHNVRETACCRTPKNDGSTIPACPW